MTFVEMITAMATQAHAELVDSMLNNTVKEEVVRSGHIDLDCGLTVYATFTLELERRLDS